MKRLTAAFALPLLALLALLIAACVPAAIEATPTATRPPRATATATPEPSPTPSPPPPPDTNCVACHSDWEQLQRLATQPPETVSLSEGSG